MLKKSYLNQHQREILRLNRNKIYKVWKNIDYKEVEKFIKELYDFLYPYLNTTDFEAWMSAFDYLRDFNYNDKEYQGFLTSINTSYTWNDDMSEQVFTDFMTSQSGLATPEQYSVFQVSK